ncbi:hypothetical protein [Companilactobacillus insicii]|uniref:hypothetical protein n=1 Tax=Companilactobacillus insicii TaxID=1732567 RepID=UPI000F7A5DF4|nr:hypothetical protein [Companilactobacillus insicii]
MVTKKYSLPQLLGFAIMIITNGAAILTVVHTYQNSPLLALTSRSLIMSAIGLVMFVGYSLIQLLIYFSIKKLNQNGYVWSIILILVGFWNYLYFIPAVWTLILDFYKRIKDYKNRPAS